MKRQLRRITAVLAALAAAAGISVTVGAAPENISAVSAIVIEADTGTALWEKNADEHRAMASTTKIMTALLTIEAGDLDREFTVDPLAILVEGTSMGLREGDRVSRRDLLYGILLPSGNDAANAAAVSVSGSIGAFVELMNSRAQELGLSNTHFVTPSGLDADGHYTTARDLAKLAAFAMKNEVFREVAACKSAEVEFGNPPYKRTLYNSNKMLRRYDGAIGVKTGYTKASGRTLVSCAQRGATRFVCVTLSDPDDWNDHTRLLDWAFENYEYRCVAGDTPVYAVPVLSGTVQFCAVTPEREAYLLLRPEDTVTLTAELPRFAFAPVQQGTRAGTLTATGPDGQSVSVALCYAEPAALDPSVKATPFARLGRLWTRVSRYFSAYYPEF